MLASALAAAWVLMAPVSAPAEALAAQYAAEYPADLYLVGEGEVEKTSSALRDRRVAEIMARRELAAQIRIRVSEQTVDILCEGADTGCRSSVTSVIETSVDEMLIGSRVVDSGERDGRVYALAVMPRADAAAQVSERLDLALEELDRSLGLARGGDTGALAEAEDAYRRARIYDKQAEVIQGVRTRSDEVFRDLEEELRRLSRGGAR
jgi:hypothetical protein